MAAGVSETGAQLFARLGVKPSLESLDPSLFPSPNFPRPGDAVEFYGPSGCGKSELLLHLISNCILPKAWRGVEIGGLGVGVVLVDADYQFSMLRLFHILERRVVDMMEEMKGRSERLKEVEISRETSMISSCLGPNTNTRAEPSSQSDTEHPVMCDQHKKPIEKISINNIADHQAVREDTYQCHNIKIRSEKTGKKPTRSGYMSFSGDDSHSSRTSECVDSIGTTKRNSCCEMPTAEQTEGFIKSCLNRFYLVRSSSSSDQLIVTLHSLESLIANRPDLSVLMLDNIAAFYWTDRMNGAVASAQEANQRRVVSIIKRLISEYQLVLFATKPALIQRNQRNNFWRDADSVTPTTRTNPLHSGTTYEHHEFMCNAWNKLITHRFVLRRHDRVVCVDNQLLTRSNYTTLRTLPYSDQPFRFIITNQGVVHQ